MSAHEAALSNEELFERLTTGDQEASELLFARLFSEHYRLVYGLALRLLGDAVEAEDVCQDVFLKVHQQLPSLRDPSKMRSWICRITVNRAYNLQRSFRRRFRWLTIPLDQCPQPPESASPLDNPERVAVSAEIRRSIDQALTSLPFAYRTVVVLRDVEELTYDEIAEVLDANIGTVKSRLARGRTALRERLRDLVKPQRRSS